MGHIRVRDPIGGSNQSGLRDQNARLVLSYIRRHGAMASAEIARRSGLSAQTVSNIVRALETQGLLNREAAVKGRVGKPSVPMALRPEGTYGLGLSIGRRSLELVLVDFKGRRVDSESTVYPYPSKQVVYNFARTQTEALISRHGLARSRVAGLGIARPNRIWEWGEFVGAPEGEMRDWQSTDLEAEMAALTGLSTVLENDATAACVAEHLLGRGHDLADFAYIFLGNFVGGGLVRARVDAVDRGHEPHPCHCLRGHHFGRGGREHSGGRCVPRHGAQPHHRPHRVRVLATRYHRD